MISKLNYVELELVWMDARATLDREMNERRLGDFSMSVREAIGW